MDEAKRDDPPQDGRKWITTADAAQRVGICYTRFVKCAKEEGLTRFRPPMRRLTCWYLLEEIESWAEFLRLRRAWHKKHPRFAGTPRVELLDAPPAAGAYLTSAQAAEIIGVSKSTLQGYVQRGRLRTYRKGVGRGHPIWFSRRDMGLLCEDAQRLHRSAGLKNGLQAKRAADECRVGEPPAPPVNPTGEWLTTPEAARILGIHVSGVITLRRNGRLHGERRKVPGVDARMLWCRLADLETLQATPAGRGFRRPNRKVQSEERRAERALEKMDRYCEINRRNGGKGLGGHPCGVW